MSVLKQLYSWIFFNEPSCSSKSECIHFGTVLWMTCSFAHSCTKCSCGCNKTWKEGQASKVECKHCLSCQGWWQEGQSSVEAKNSKEHKYRIPMNADKKWKILFLVWTSHMVLCRLRTNWMSSSFSGRDPGTTMGWQIKWEPHCKEANFTLSYISPWPTDEVQVPSQF